MHNHYVKMYPNHHYWDYHYGYRIASIPAHKAKYYVGDIKNAYGTVTNINYLRYTDEYILRIRSEYRSSYLTVVIPVGIIRMHTNTPSHFFVDKHINVTGLITSYKGNPEILVKRNSQIDIY